MPRNSATNRSKQRNYNAAIAFNGSSSELLKSTPTGLNTGSGSMSFVTWAFINNRTLVTYADLLAPVMGRRFCLGYSGFCYYFSDGVNGANNLTLTDAQFESIGTNKFVRLVWALTSTAVSIYCNGALIKTQSLGVTMNSGTYTKLTIGDTGSGLQYVNGILADSYFTNSALSLEEVQEDYYKAVYPSGLASAWLMGEGAGSAITDRVGSNSLTAANITWTSQTPAKSRKLSVNANMVKNGDFEYAPPFTAATTTDSRWIDGTAAGSTTNDLFLFAFSRTGSNGQAYFDNTVTRNSASLFSIKVSTTGVNTLARARTLRVVDAPNVLAYGIPLSPNTSYTLSGWMKTAYVSGGATTGAFFRVSERTASSTQLATNDTTYIKVTSDWTRYTTTFTTNASTRYGEIQLLVEGNIGTATLVMDAWFDDIVLTPVYPEGRVPANGNLVKNFDFEVAPTFVAAHTSAAKWIDGTAAGSTTNATYKWAALSGAVTVSASVSFDSTVAHSGSSSLKLSTLDASGAIGVSHTLATSPPATNTVLIPLNPSTSYTLNFYLKTTNVATNGAFAFVREYSSTLGTLVTTNTSKLSGTNDWTLVTLTFTTSATTQYGAIALFNNVAGNISDAWFDDIYLAKTTNPGRVLIT